MSVLELDPYLKLSDLQNLCLLLLHLLLHLLRLVYLVLLHHGYRVAICVGLLPWASCRRPLRNGRTIPVQEWPASGRVHVRSARCAPRAATTAAGRRPRISVGV